MAQRRSNLLATVAKTAITLLLLGLLFHKIDYAATLRRLLDIRLITVVFGLAILYAATALATLRWRIVLRSIGRSFTSWCLFRLNLIGMFFNQALPSAIGGDGMRIWLLYRIGCSFTEAFNSVLIDRGAGFVALAIMSLYGLPTLDERLFAIPKIETIAGVIIAVVVLLFLLYALARSGVRVAKSRVGRFVAQIVSDTLFLAGRPGDSAKIILLSICSQSANFVLIWLILRDLGADVSFVGVMIVAPVVVLFLVLPISIAGWGLREGLFVVGFGLLNVSKDVALAASIVFGLINLLAGLIGGIFWILEPARSGGATTATPANAETGLAAPPSETA